MEVFHDIFSLSLGEVFGLFFVGYLFLSFIMWCLDGFFNFLAWGFHALLARLAARLDARSKLLPPAGSQSGDDPTGDNAR